MLFKSGYYHPMDREYIGNKPGDIERPLLGVEEVGKTVTEGGRFGTLIEQATGAIREGVGRIELQTQMEGATAEAAGAESYGKDARRDLREMAKANQITITGVHAPTQIGNMSGYAGPERGFVDEQRKTEVEEIKKAIKFAAEAAQGGAVVVHTGEFQRPISEQPWAKTKEGDYLFKHYQEEVERAVIPIVDDRTGRMLSQIRKNEEVPRAVWNRYKGKTGYVDDKGQRVEPDDYIDYEKNKVSFKDRVPEYDEEKGTFKVHREKWENFVREAKDRNREFEKKFGRKPVGDEIVKPEEAFIIATTETQEKISEGWAQNYAQGLDREFKLLKEIKKARDFYARLEAAIPKEERWKLMKQVSVDKYGNLTQLGIIPAENKLPTELIDERLKEVRRDITARREMVTGQRQQALQQRILRDHAVAIDKYAKKQTMKSYVEAGVYAMDVSHTSPYVKKDVFIAPENIWPEMGYGSHPEELIELVREARKAMADHLVKQRKYDQKTAEKEARDHIKATLDTQHMGMWWKHFQFKQGETEEDARKRFNRWYMDEIRKMEKEGIIGNIHLVDSIGGGHQHLAVGQGNLPLKTALRYLKEKGYTGYISSEAHGEERFGKGRMIMETWKALGSPIYGALGPIRPGAPQSFSDIHQSYFGQHQSPYYVFGGYAPSNDWTLWTQVPLE